VVEILMALAVLGIVARVGIPNANEYILAARGAAVLREISAVEEAVAAYVSETGRWPEDAPPGEVPPELSTRFLDEEVSFTHRDYVLDFDHWSLDGELGSAAGRDEVAAVSVEVMDEGLRRGLLRVAAPRIWYRSGVSFGFILQGP
jgi:type II secretory pathway pseudopilin PulG